MHKYILLAKPTKIHPLVYTFLKVQTFSVLIENLILGGSLTKYSRCIHTSWNVGEAVGVILRISMWVFLFCFFYKSHVRHTLENCLYALIP